MIIISKKKHLRIVRELKKQYDNDMLVKDTIIKHKNNEIKEVGDLYEAERENSNSYFEANKKLLQELHKIKKDYKSLKRKCDRLQSKNKHKGGK